MVRAMAPISSNSDGLGPDRIIRLASARPVEIVSQPAGQEGTDADDELIARIGGGDAQAWQPLVDRHLARLVGFAWHILGDRSEAEDVAQEVLIRLMRKAPEWQPGGAKVRSWLYRVAVNLCIDRKRKTRPLQLDEDAPIADPTAGDREIDRRMDIERAVRRALDELPERQRIALVLVHYHGFSNPETAQMMEASVEAVESMLARGRRTLRANLKALAGELLGA